MSFGLIRARDLILVDHEGKVVEGDWPVNTAAFAIHSQIHAARPDVKAAAHTHSPYGRAFSTLGKTLDPLTQDVCAFYGDHAVFDDFTGVVLDVEEGKRIAHALADNKAAILRNHGLLTVGQTVDEAAWWFITMERSCQVQLMADAAGDPVLIDDECATLDPRPGRLVDRRVVQLPAALRQDRGRAARPARLTRRLVVADPEEARRWPT